MDTMMHPDNLEEDTGEQWKIQQVAEVPLCTGDAGPDRPGACPSED
jgi:hypothetical protein